MIKAKLAFIYQNKMFGLFFSYLKHEKRYSKHTVTAYQRDLKIFYSFMQEYLNQNIDIDVLKNLSITHFRAWMSFLRSQHNYSTNSINRSLAAIKSYYRWLKKEYNLSNPSLSIIKSPRKITNLPKALTHHEMNILLKKNNTNNWIYQRNYTLLILLYATGLRISEALQLNWSDLSKDTITVIGKGEKERIIPILPIVKHTLFEYQNLCPFQKEQAIFLNTRGKRLQARSCQLFLSKLRRQLNLPETTTPHSIRHTFATHLLNGGADLRSIQKLLGHASLSTTQKYTDIDLLTLLKEYNTLHPRQNN